MLKNRLIPCILLKGETVVQSFGFKSYLPIGKIDAAIEFFVDWDVDEIIILDMAATSEKRSFSSEIIKKATRKCFIPLCVGGGIKSLDDISRALDSGADKVSINSSSFRDPSLISKAADKYGSQCVTISIDAKRMPFGNYHVFVNGGKVDTNMAPNVWAKRVEKLGAGEIFLTSIDNDGRRSGYDLELLNSVTSEVSIPVIASGGVGHPEHFLDGIIKGNCQAVAAANIFQHTELSTIAAKSYLDRKKLPIRLSSKVNYSNFVFDSMMGRPV